MSADTNTTRHSSRDDGGNYRAKPVEIPPLYAWPPRPLAALKYLLVDMLFPWGYAFLLLAFPTWWFLTPELSTMATFEPGWIGLIWLRNCVFLCALAGFLHWHLHGAAKQGKTYQLNRRTLGGQQKLFLWNNQTRDNMFWSIASGVTVWTGFEAITFWVYASGRQVVIADNPGYFVITFYLLFLWSTTNFYLVHRFLHWQPVYRRVHELHHRNVNVGPWSGISMHPIEHLLYFTPFVLWWFIPVHPVIIVLTGFYQGLNPALSHAGFDYVQLGSRWRLKTGDLFHTLHHQYFDLNYGNSPTPYDKLFGSWCSGSDESVRAQLERRRMQRTSPN